MVYRRIVEKRKNKKQKQNKKITINFSEGKGGKREVEKGRGGVLQPLLLFTKP